jgi:hypothetical protein
MGVRTGVNFGQQQVAEPVVQVDASGLTLGQTYTLASNVASLASGASTTPVTGLQGGSYIFDAQFAGTSPSLKLQVLGSDGTTWRDVGAALTAPGSASVVIGGNASVRLLNAGANAITGLYGTLT